MREREREREKQSCSVSGGVKMLCSGLIKGQAGHLTSNRTDESNVKEDKTVVANSCGWMHHPEKSGLYRLVKIKKNI